MAKVKRSGEEVLLKNHDGWRHKGEEMEAHFVYLLYEHFVSRLEKNEPPSYDLQRQVIPLLNGFQQDIMCAISACLFLRAAVTLTQRFMERTGFKNLFFNKD